MGGEYFHAFPTLLRSRTAENKAAAFLFISFQLEPREWGGGGRAAIGRADIVDMPRAISAISRCQLAKLD